MSTNELPIELIELIVGTRLPTAQTNRFASRIRAPDAVPDLEDVVAKMRGYVQMWHLQGDLTDDTGLFCCVQAGGAT